MKQKIKTTLLIASIFTVVSCMVIPFVASQGEASIIIANTADFNVLAMTGTGFDPNATVTITMYQQGGLTPLQTFSSVTDSEGNFVTTLTLQPVLTTGIYTFSASTSNVNAFTGHVIFNPSDQQTPSPGPTTKSVNATPNNSNIFNVTGSGFVASREVTLVLKNPQGATVYRFPDELSTDTQGRFSTIAIVPTSINGTFTLEA